MCIPLVPPPLSHKFPNEEKKKLTSMQYQHTIQLTCISNQSINLVGNSLLSVNTARLLKGASTHCPTLGFFYLATLSACAFPCSCEWFPHLSIAITPNNSLPAS